MNLRKAVYFAILRLRGQALGPYFKRIWREFQEGIPPDTTKKSLVQILEHCKQSVPYYGEVMHRHGDSFRDDPAEYLRHFPILTKDIIRSRFDDLKSKDLDRRKWNFNTSGGSTGEPIKFIQDWEYSVKSGAIKLLYSTIIGREIGERELYLWSAARYIGNEKRGLKFHLINKLTNTSFMSVFRMTPEQMRTNIETINAKRPKLLVAYATGLYELAKFAEQKGLEVFPPESIITSAATLYPVMREKIEKVFQCPVFNRYGSREVGDIACERPGFQGLWVPPWGHYVEIVDDEGNRVPDGSPGDILVTSLINYAMPLIRYKIEDQGILSPGKSGQDNQPGQVFMEVLGRSLDIFVNKNGTLVSTGHFMPLLYFRDWIQKYQVIQKSHSRIVFRIVKGDSDPKPGELEELAAKTNLIMGSDCETIFEFTDEISPPPSGKHRFLISEIPR
ncbi:MAG: phenylacetate--CoA ligase family protein [Candidatus Aminicenantes bacterium]|nr:MAG: phenylacetate--CoA ligase family protein [Candidatus Aminicenantes bacterium]